MDNGRIGTEIMKTLEEYNEEYTKRREEAERRKFFTGIECPHCKDIEMKYDSPDTFLMSNPPQQTIFCPQCNYKTNIFV